MHGVVVEAGTRRALCCGPAPPLLFVAAVVVPHAHIRPVQNHYRAFVVVHSVCFPHALWKHTWGTYRQLRNCEKVIFPQLQFEKETSVEHTHNRDSAASGFRGPSASSAATGNRTHWLSQCCMNRACWYDIYCICLPLRYFSV